MFDTDFWSYWFFSHFLAWSDFITIVETTTFPKIRLWNIVSRCKCYNYRITGTEMTFFKDQFIFVSQSKALFQCAVELGLARGSECRLDENGSKSYTFVSFYILLFYYKKHCTALSLFESLYKQFYMTVWKIRVHLNNNILTFLKIQNSHLFVCH